MNCSIGWDGVDFKDNSIEKPFGDYNLQTRRVLVRELGFFSLIIPDEHIKRIYVHIILVLLLTSLTACAMSTALKSTIED